MLLNFQASRQIIGTVEFALQKERILCIFKTLLIDNQITSYSKGEC